MAGRSCHAPAALSFPHTEQACAEVLSLPMYAELTDAMVDRVAGELIAFMKK